MTADQTKLSPVVYVLIAVLLWSTGGLFIKLTTLDAYQVTFFRSLFAAITVLILTRKNGLKINAFGIFTSIIYALIVVSVRLGDKENHSRECYLSAIHGADLHT